MLKVCIAIFFARAIDVTLGTVKTVFTIKGKTLLAASIAFAEVFVWFLVAREALNTPFDSLLIPICYAGGYATGTMIGTYIANNFIKGLICVQVITKKNNKKLIDKLRDLGYGVSIVPLKNDYDAIKREMLFIEIQKKNLKELKRIIEDIDATAFIIVNETKVVHNGQIK